MSSIIPKLLFFILSLKSYYLSSSFSVIPTCISTRTRSRTRSGSSSFYHPSNDYEYGRPNYNKYNTYRRKLQQHPKKQQIKCHQVSTNILKLFSSSKEDINEDINEDTNEDTNQVIEYEEWIAGDDLQLDMKKLHSAVAKSNADTDLDQKERLHLLDEFAKQRRELYPDVTKYVLRPLLLALILSSSSSSMISNGGGRHMYYHLTKIINSFMRVMNISYGISIIAPLIMYHWANNNNKKKKKENTQSKKTEFLFDLDNPKSDDTMDCSDYSYCLLENWVSSIYPSAIFQGLLCLSSLLLNRYFNSNSYNIYNNGNNQLSLLFKGFNLSFFIFGTKVSRFITRLGAAASLHQFPKLLYELRRSNQPRPIALLPTMLNKVINAYLWVLPIGFASDVAQLGIYTYSMRWNGLLKTNFFQKHLYVKMMYISLFFSIIVPMVHLFALTKIIRIGNFTNISLAMDQEKAIALLDEKETDGFKLRYKLQWRPPIRLFQSGRKLLRTFTLFLFTGWGEKASIVDDTTASSNEPLILTLIGKEMENGMNPKFLDRSNWIRDASENMARVHQQNYMDGTFDDPLGIAFQQTFGIGLSLDFDHDSRLVKGETASIHRLRARAAKSAIKCYNAIPQQVEQYVQNIPDEEKRVEEYTRLVEKERGKLMEVAMEVSTLIPTNAPSPEGKDMDIFSMKNSEADQLDSLSIPWLKPDSQASDDDIYNDPYLSYEDAFTHDLKQKYRKVELPDNDDEDIFKPSKTVIT